MQAPRPKVGRGWPICRILLDDALRYRETSILDEWRSRALVEVDGIYCMGTGLGVARVM